jgi:hypothetical protein
MAWRRRRSIEAWRSGERGGGLEGLGSPRTGFDDDTVLLVTKVARRACRASLTASASMSASWPSAYALHVRRAISSTAAVFRAAAAAAVNWSASIASPFGIQVPPKGRARFRQNSAGAKIGSCVGLNFRGYEGCYAFSFPRLAGTPARLHWRVSCFWASFSPIGPRIAPRAGDSLRRVASTPPPGDERANSPPMPL